MGLIPEEKLLRTILKLQAEDKGYPIKQDPPICPRCLIKVDIYDPSVKVQFRDIEIGGKVFTVAEPYCPMCFTKIKSDVQINN